jgi:hypothetical protein
MKTFSLCLIAALFSFSSSFAQSPDEIDIRKSMNEQLEAWNKGDINRFMDTYWQADSDVYRQSGVTYGWKETKENYIQSYPDTAAMGKLDFKIIEVKRLSVLYFHVVGRWQLTRSIGTLAAILLFKKVKNKWVIV